jgi:ABC-type tungstate transport system permease subunit
MKRRVPVMLLWLMGMVACIGALAASAEAGTLTIDGTSDVTDSNLYAGVITSGFAAYDSSLGFSDTLTYNALGSGAALTAAENPANGVDVVLVHSPALEAPFVAGGYSYEPLGRATFYNDYVIVGPTGDPAGVATSDRHNAVGAFAAIAAQGNAHSNVTFVSRADASGTNVKEQQIWGQADALGVTTQEAFNGGTDTTRQEPATSSTPPLVYPSWYKHTAAVPPSQGNNLISTNTCSLSSYPDGNCYTIVDRGTWDYESSLGNTSNLKIVSDVNASTAPGGLGELTNPFHAYIVSSSSNKAAAGRFLDYLTSTGFQNALKTFGSGNDFVPDAYAKISSSTLPTSHAAGSISFAVTLLYSPPVAQPIDGMPVQLQSAPASSGPWTNVGSPVNTTGSGVASFTTTLSATTYYRISMGTYDDTLLASQFSPNTNAALNTSSPPGKVTCSSGC